MELLMARRRSGKVILQLDPSNQVTRDTNVIDRSGFNVMSKFGTITVADDGPMAGVKSLYFNPANGRDYCWAPNQSSWPNILTGDFTMELRYKMITIPGVISMLGNWIQAVGQGGTLLYLDANGRPCFSFGPATENGSVIIATSIPSLNVWHSLAVTRKGSTFRLFIDGILNTTYTSSATRGPITAAMTIGLYQNSSGGFPDSFSVGPNGYLTRIRITQGFARYTANYTPTY